MGLAGFEWFLIFLILFKVSVKKQKNVGNLLKLLEKWLTYKFRKFRQVFNVSWFCLTLSVLEKLRNLILDIPIATQTLSINNLRTTSAKSINLYTIRKLVEYSLKIAWQRQCFLLPFWRCCSRQVGLYYDPPSREERAKGLRFQ